ncbi:protein transporter SEC61 subunit gamma [Cladophialophora yegresii CBS 114405]|uniref:Protein transporter SEC61 subunit gamma n=1 Tax=Cladophialophora yegresii CBS 114405 TaxID=1182544 RepID=W9WIC6_9EURO|nr:protein transporter SEC61 subunit gamma [Cladophialophora yegresii CBS 114405]EXJ64336.1 protein transporter SEC61 subunit gamma [Cladophialophora yegresii CBS 114405]
MSDLVQEIADVPKEFFREGTQFIHRCTKPDRREFIKISQAVGMGFLIMGAIGYFIKLSEWNAFIGSRARRSAWTILILPPCLQYIYR